MTAPLTAERREYIERRLCIRLLQYSGQEYETTHCYNGLRDEAAATIGELLAEIDRLTADRDAAVAAAVMAERGEIDADLAAFSDAVERSRIAAAKDDPALALHNLIQFNMLDTVRTLIRSRPAPAPAVEGRTP